MVLINFNINFRMYQDKLASLKDQLNQLEQGIHPEYLRRIKRLEQVHQDRILLNEAIYSFEVSLKSAREFMYLEIIIK